MMAMGWVCHCVALLALAGTGSSWPADLDKSFAQPEMAARPWVYWMISDGNLSREGITADLQAMHDAGIGGVIIMEVDVGIPRGPVAFMSLQWCELFRHAVEEAERLEMQITLNAGPGWTGSGGPWVPANRSMQHLVASEVSAHGPQRLETTLPRPAPREPYFGAQGLPAEMLRDREAFYEDVAVLAVPVTDPQVRIPDILEKALYVRDPYTSMPGVRPYIAPSDSNVSVPASAILRAADVVDLTNRMSADGKLTWDVPAGDWTILRMGRRTTGANTRPAPQPGLGWECDKFDRTALDAHFDQFIGKLLKVVGPRPTDRSTGWTMLHIDSWEMGAQNWSAAFAEEFQRRRGYDPRPYLPVMTGRVVESMETSERFLWDLRRTAQELVISEHAAHLRELGKRHGFGLSIEPYDMNPAGDMTLGSVADVPMCEFWSLGYVMQSLFSCTEATSIAHTNGRPIVAAEAFTADAPEAWKFFPATLKDQGDWAFCTGINRLVFHRYAHQPWLDRRPGMTMGPYGVHWERTQTWWPMVGAYHEYLARCQTMLRAGTPVADILYLVPEGAPHVFRAPPSAMDGKYGDRKGYNFDGCPSETLMASASVVDGKVVFPGGTSYRLLVLPAFETMTPSLLTKVRDLIAQGATVVGAPPTRSPSLSDYPQCDAEIQRMVNEIWGAERQSETVQQRDYGKGRVWWGGDLRCGQAAPPETHPILNSQWIWYPEGNPAASAPPGKVLFTRAFELDNTRKILSAIAEFTADNTFELWINGRRALEGDNFHIASRADVTGLLRDGQNELVVLASNGTDQANPAGLIGAVSVTYQDGASCDVFTDASWRCARWTADATKSIGLLTDASGAPAQVLGNAAMAPWSLNPVDTRDVPIYPHYAATARILAEIGTQPDFESDGSVRYTHRSAEDGDIFFVANRTEEAVTTECIFRTDSGVPERWDPVSGKMHAVPEYARADGRTRMTLEFAPHQSYFIVFRRAAHTAWAATSDTVSLPQNVPLQTVTGPWRVTFDPALGGPAEKLFPDLSDWSLHADPGIRHYSGIAHYHATMTLATLPSDGARLWLDLGTVHNLARVRLNGHDLGVIWCAPWNVEVTGAIHAGENQLEIEVANLWPNRLIADSGLPEEQRRTWTTWNPFRPTDTLLPSGLVGPVVLKK
jgi:hypothetical protein